LKRESAACSGAVIKDLTEPSLKFAEPPQLDAELLPESSLVTISIGSSDAMFASLLAECEKTGGRYFGGPTCDSASFVPSGIGKSFRQQVEAAIDSLAGGRLEQVYRTASAKASNAEIIAVGYPYIFSDKPGTEKCLDKDDYVGFPSKTNPPIFQWSEKQWMRQLGDRLNEVISDAAKAAGIRYLDTREYFKGHEVCANNKPSRGNYIIGYDKFKKNHPELRQELFHPNRRGQVAYATAVSEFLEDIDFPNKLNKKSQPLEISEVQQEGVGPVIPPPESGLLSAEALVAGCGVVKVSFAPAQAVDIFGSGYAADTDVELWLKPDNQEPQLLEILQSDDQGLVHTSIVLPVDMPTDGLGLAFLKATGENANGALRSLYNEFQIVTSADTDTDEDLIPDICDICIETQNADQIDSDGDGLGDDCDVCPNDPEDDWDEDGECADVDVCPFDPLNRTNVEGLCFRLENVIFDSGFE